jgi:hypothetical protein
MCLFNAGNKLRVNAAACIAEAGIDSLAASSRGYEDIYISLRKEFINLKKFHYHPSLVKPRT